MRYLKYLLIFLLFLPLISDAAYRINPYTGRPDYYESGTTVNSTNVNAAGAVMETDFNASTFLYATTDDTPAVKTPTEVLPILAQSPADNAYFIWNPESNSSTNWHAVFFDTYRSKGTQASPTTVASGDDLQVLSARGHDGTNYVQALKIITKVADTVSGGVVPISHDIQTMNSGGTLASRIKINKSGGLVVPIPIDPVVHTDATYLVVIATDLGQLHVADRATDVTFTLPAGTANGQYIKFSKENTGNCLISGTIYDDGTSHTLLTGSTLGGEVGLRWSTVLSAWKVVDYTQTWVGSTP